MAETENQDRPPRPPVDDALPGVRPSPPTDGWRPGGPGGRRRAGDDRHPGRPTSPPVHGDERPAPPEPRPEPNRRRRRALAAAVAAAILLPAIVLLRDGVAENAPGSPLALPGEDEEPEAAPAPTTTVPPPPEAPHPPPDGPSVDIPPAPEPDVWDPQFVELVEFVERTRELAFAHPVAIQMIDATTYDEAGGGGSSGLYNGQSIMIRGTELTDAVRGTIVHELTHAVDDHHFGLSPPAEASPERQMAFMGLVEGDAVRIEDAYDRSLVEGGVDPEAIRNTPLPTTIGPVPTLPPGTAPTTPPTSTPVPAPVEPDTEDADEGEGADGEGEGEEGGGEDGGVPTTLGSLTQAGEARGVTDESIAADLPTYGDATTMARYEVFPLLPRMLYATGGNAAVDAAFADPPTTAEHVLDPRSYIDRQAELPVKAPDPAGASGSLFEVSSVGAFDLYLLLAAGIEPSVALGAVTGWGGDGGVGYRDATGQRCVGVAAVGDNEAETTELHEAFAAWADSGVAAESSYERRPEDGAAVLFACGLGAGSDPTVPDLTMRLPAARRLLAGRAMDAGFEAGAGFGYGHCVTMAISLDTLVGLLSGEVAGQGPRIAEAAAGC